MPMMINEVVVVGEESYETTRMVEIKNQARQAAEDEEEPEIEPADRPISFKAKPEERKGGDKLSAFLALCQWRLRNCRRAVSRPIW